MAPEAHHNAMDASWSDDEDDVDDDELVGTSRDDVVSISERYEDVGCDLELLLQFNR